MIRITHVSLAVAKKLVFALAFTLGIFSSSWAQPINDLIDDAIPLLPPSGTIAGTTIGATFDSGLPFIGTSITAPGVWYKFIGSGEVASLDTNSGLNTYDTKLHVFSNFTGGVTGLVGVVGNDDILGCVVIFCSGVNFTSDPGIQYHVMVSGFSSQTGNFGLNYDIGLPSSVPEPSSIALFAAALFGLGFASRKMRN